MKNRIATGLFLLAQYAAFAQQSILNGTVTVFNSQFETGKKQYVANAQVEEDYGKSQATTTNTEGFFKLPLVGIKDLEKVFFNVKKASYEVVNTDALQAVAGQKEVVQVYLAKEGVLAENKRKYYQINRTASEKAVTEKLVQLGQQIETLQQNKATNKTKIETVQAEYARLQDNFKKIEETARELAERYAKTNLDDASAEYQRAFRYFQRGLLDSALFVFQKMDLEQTAQFVVREQNRTAALKTEYETRNSEKNKQKVQTTEALLFKANLHQTKFEFNKAENTYLLLIKLDSTNVNNLWEFAYFLLNQNQIEQAISYYEKALSITKYESLVGLFCNNLGLAYTTLNKMTQAETFFLKSLEIRERLSKNNPQRFEEELASTELNLGGFYYKNNKILEAEKHYLKSLEIRERLTKNNSQQFEPDLSKTAMNLGIVYETLNKMPESEKYYLKSLYIYENLSKRNPMQFEADLARIAMNLGIFYYTNRKMLEAEKYCLKSLEIYERLTKNNLQQYEPELGLSAMNLGITYEILNKMPDSEKYYLKSLNIFERLSKSNPQQFEPDLSKTAMNLGLFYYMNNKMLESEKYYLKSLEIRERLSINDPQQFEPNLAATLMNLGIFYETVNKMPESEKYYLKSLYIYERLSKNDPQKFEPHLAAILNNYGVFCKSNNKYQEAINLLIRALTLRQTALLNGQIYFFEEYKRVFINLDDFSDSFKVQKNYMKVIEIQSVLAKSNDILKSGFKNGNTVTAERYGSLAWYQLFVKTYTDAEQSAVHGLELDPTQTWIKTNLAHALLFQNKNSDAKKVYDELKNQKNTEGVSYQDLLTQDFNILEQAGLDKTQLDKARQWIKD